MPFIRLFLVVIALCNINTAQAADILLPKEISAFSFPTAELLMPCPGGPGVIGGHAFQDFNYNGLDDQIGKRIKGIEVNLFSCGLSGESELVGTTVTDENGDYFFPSLVDGQEYRIEFSTPEDLFYMQSGFSATQSRTTVQFITSPSCDISIGLANPDDYCEEDPKLVVPCYINGNPMALNAGGDGALVMFNTSYEGVRPAPDYIATTKEIGSTWGLTYNKITKEIYTSAFLKRHVGLGSLGLGGIYKVDINGTTSMVSPFFDLNDLGANIGIYPSNGDRGLSGDINLPSNDPMAYDDIGKKGMGGLTMSADGNTLYVIGLSDKMLHVIDISSGTPTAANLQSYPIPDPGCSGGEFRPFGIQIYNEEIYVGGVCDAETSGLKSDLKAIVYRLDGTTFSEVLNFSLDFQKGLASRSCNDDRGWFPWTSEVPEECFVSGDASIIVHPTPILSDIEFDANGDMVIGFMDRIGNQLGYLNYGPTGQTELYSAFTGGDIMKATPNGDGTFIIENNGTAGPNTTVGANNGEGIGGGEFFSFDVFEIAPNIPRPHSETAQGGIALIKGTNQVIGTSLDPFGTFVNSGGVNYWDLSTGDVRDPGYVIFRSGSNSISTFSKANGLGDVATLCSLAPIELGGRIWVDVNTNGIQDPCEMILSDISVTLYTSDGTEVGTTVSNASGDYFFSDDIIRPNEEYFAVFGSATQTQTPLALLDIYTPTAKNIGMGPNTNLNDSDVQVGNILGITNALYIPIATAGPGSVSHANDAGFFEIPPPVGANITGQVFDDLNQDGLQSSGEPYIEGIVITLFNADGTIVATTETDNNGNYIFQNVLEGNYYVGVNLQTSVDGAVLDVEPTALDAGDDTLDSDFDPNTGQTSTFVFDPNDGNKDFDAGVFRPSGMINGIAFDDFNGDGIQDANEPAIGGITVTLLDCNDAVIATVTTDEGGNYSFGDLDKGDYKVRFDPSGNNTGVANYIASPKGEGTDDTKDSDIDNSFTSDCVSIFLDPIEIDGGFVVPKTTITGTAFEDINADGTRADTDLPIAGITVILSDCKGNEIARTITDDSGNYVFDNLEFGDYEVQFDQVGNENGIDHYEASPKDVGGDDTKDSDIDAQFNSDCVSLMENPIVIDAGFNEPKATVVGSAFEDLDGDGIQDPEEGLILNLIVSLVDCDGTIVATTITDEFGNYSFGDVSAGDYKIVFGTPLDTNGNEFSATEQNAGDDDTIDSDIGADNSTECTSLEPNSDNDISAGFVPPSGEINGFVFYDENKDGIQDAGELGIPGVTVELQDCKGTVIASTVTDNNGNYSFTGNLSNDYILVFNSATNTNGITDFTTSPKGAGGDESLDSDTNIITNASDCVSFDPSKGLEIDAGFFRPTGILQVSVFDDLNGNGIHDIGEPAIQGVTVILQNCEGNDIATTITDINGSYSFGDILAGNYQIAFDPSTNVRGITNYHASPTGFDSDIDPLTNTSVCFFFDPITGFMIQAGFVQPTGTLTGFVFNDLNQDGIQDANEPFFGGITVALQDCNGLTVATTISNPDGSYSFDEVLLGNYKVVFNPTTNTEGISGLVASPSGNDSDIDPATNTSDCVAFDPEKGLGIDAGFYEPVGAITGTSFEDLDGDGIQDPDEGLIIGLTVSLVDCNGTIIATVLTDEFGNYSFGMVAAGDYQIVFGPPTDINGNEFSATQQDAGDDDTIDSDIDPATNSTSCISYDPVVNTNINAGFIPPTGDLMGTVFNDENRNGIQDPGEIGIEGVTVRLQDCNGLTIETTTTDQNGNYTFTNLLSNSYQIVFDGATNTDAIPNLIASPKDVGGNDSLDSDINSNSNTDCLPFNSSEGLDVDAGFFQPTGTLTGVVFNDINQDGVLDANEPFFGGITVALQDCNGLTVATTVSNPDGSYSFDEVLVGDYQVVFNPTTNTEGINNLLTSPRGNDSDIDPTTNASECVAFSPDKGLEIDAGFYEPVGSITGTSFEDSNEDGIQDPDEGLLIGLTVSLIDCNGTVVATALTDEFGNYSFGMIAAGDYEIVFGSPTDTNGNEFTATEQNAGDDDTKDSDIDPATNSTGCISYDPVENTNINAGFIPPTGDLMGTVFYDENRNGIQDAGEIGIGNVTVRLQDCNGGTIETTTTDNNGNYTFTNLLSDSYQIVFDESTNTDGIPDFTASPKDVGGNDEFDSDINNTNTTDCLPFNAGEGLDIDAGFFRPSGSFIGSIFNDLNGDGIQDANEPGIGGVTVELQDCNGVVVATTTTNPDGSYTFDDILEGNYQVYFNPNTNTQGIPNFEASPEGGDSDINPSTNTSECVAFDPTKGVEVNAGFTQPTGTLVGIVFNDLNGDGIQDANEPGIGGITVELQDCNGAIVATTTTNPDGSYSFGDIILGSYQVFFNPNTNTQGIPNFDTSPEGGDSNINPSTNTSECVAFDPEKGAEIDAGFVQPTGTLEGVVFNDINGDGIRDANESSIGGVTVELQDCNGVVLATTTTNPDGSYSFGDLLLGSYQVYFDPNTNTDGNSQGIPNFETSPSGRDSDIDPITNTSECIAFDPAQGAEIDAGFTQPLGTLIGLVFEDLNGNGIQEANEPSIGGVTVELQDCNGVVLAVTTTNAGGNYSFGGLLLGDYQVYFNPNTNDRGIPDFETAPSGGDSNINPSTNTSECIAFDPNVETEIDAGFTQPTGIIMGTVFNDVDGDGMQEPGEGAIEGVTVSLLDCNGTVLATTTTNENGNYYFEDRTVGSYQVVFDVNTNTDNILDYQNSPENRGDDTMDSDIDPITNTSDCFQFNPTIGADIDAGFIQPVGELMGTIFNDIDADGMQEPGEVGIRGVTVVLLDGDGTTIGTTTTDANGNYFFTNLISGAYQVLIDPATNSAGIDDYMNSPANQGDEAMDSDINPSTNRSDIFTFVAAEGGDIDGGLFQPAEPVVIGNMVFKDCNKNGILDAGETGQGGIVVMLSGTTMLGDAVNQQTQSNQDGTYQFNIGRPGIYQVMFVIPDDLTGIEFSPQNIGDNDLIDSDANPRTGIVAAFEVESGEIVSHVDVGVTDLAAPLIFNVPPDITVSCNNPPDRPTAVKAVDNCDPKVEVAFDERVEERSCGSSIVRTWTAEDECGNITRKQQTITIRDEEAPVITLSNALLAGIPNGGSITFDCDALPEFDENDIIATDNCDTDLTIEFVDLIRREGNCQVDGYLTEMTCGWRAIDDCGNETEYIITITVVDTRAPMLNNIPVDATVNLSEGQPIPPVPTNIGATDNCDENISIQFEQTQTEDTACGYDLIRTWTAIDNCGNKEAVSQTISLIRDCVCPGELSDGQMVLHAACDGSTGGMILFNLTADARYYEFDFVPNLGIPNSLGNARTDLPLGTYNIVVTYKGAADCKETYNINIGTMETATISIADSKKASCGQADGFVSLAPASFQYVWSDGIAGAQRSDLPAGTYKVNYTDDNGCLGSTEITVEEPENCICLNFTIDVLQNTSPSCSGGTDGNLIVLARGGRETVLYEWSNGSAGTTLSNITAGMYTVIATDGNGCQTQEEIMVMAPESVMLTINQTNGGCGEKGVIDLHAQGGTGPYTYHWSTGATSQDLLAVPTGSYTVTVTDANNCTNTSNTIISNGGAIDIQLGKQLPTCSDNSNGIVFATVTGGKAPYVYQWSDGSTAKDLRNISKGDYSLVVTDVDGCQSAAQISVEAPSAINILLTPKTYCDKSIGDISATVTGGTAPYTYRWNFGATTAVVQNLITGTYSLTVTDGAGCEATEVITLNVPAAFAINPIVVSPSCANTVGSISLNASGGMLPHTYTWSNGSTESSLEGISTGTYSATVVDQRGCSLIYTETFSSIAPLDGSSSTINPSCADGTDGQIMVEVTGGTQPYSYQWQTGATTKDLTGVGAGLYNMTVTDANGCQFIFTEGLLRTGPITISVQQRTDALCESANGSLSIAVQGGAAPYTYRWNTGATSTSLTNLVAGNYEVTVTDTKGCMVNQLFVISSDCTCPSPLYTQIMVNNAKCGNSNGSIMIMVDQLERYTFDWGAVGTVGAANNERRNLPAGQYNVRVTYAGQMACSEIIAVTVGNSVAGEATVVANVPAACDQNNGQIELAPATFIYQWADGVLGYNRTNLAPGVYDVQVLDDNGCSSTKQVSVTRTACNTPTIPTAPTCRITAALNITSNPTCDDLSAAIEVIAIGGQVPYTYQWNLGTIGNIQNPRGLSIGTYEVTVTDAGNCTATARIIVAAPNCGTPTNPTTPTTPTVPTTPSCEVLISLSTVNAKCAGEPSGTAAVTVIDGKSPYTYLWSNGQTTAEVADLLAGVYSVTVTDAKGCIGVEATTVTAPTALSFMHEIVGGDCDKVEVAFSGLGGTSVWKWICDGQEGAINETILLRPGTYTCFVMDNQWCSSSTQTITIEAISQENCGGSVVPEEGQFQFTEFEGKIKGETFAALEWVTKDEVHQGSFLIEHSTDGNQFEVIGIAITAIGPTLVGGYNQLTTLPNFGSNYFRIKYVDVIGNTVISEVIELFKKLPRSADKAIVYPNPIAEEYTIDFLRPIEEDKEMIITNNLGRIIDRMIIPAGTIKYALDAATYKAGIYTLMVSNKGTQNTTIRFVKLEL